MMHVCSRDDCKPANVSGPSAKCGRCGKIGFLFCHGFTMHGNDYVKCELPNGSKLVLSLTSFHWVCQACSTAGMVITSTGPMTPKPSNNNNSKEKVTIVSTLNEIKKMLSKNQEEVIERLDEIGPAVMKNETECRSIIMKLDSEERQNSFKNGRDLANLMFKRQQPSVYEIANGNEKSTTNNTPKQRTYATVLQSKLVVKPQLSSSTTTPSKRKRDTEIALIENASQSVIQKAKIPTPKKGTKIAQIGKPLEIRTIEPKKTNPLTKSIRIAGLHPETTTEEVDKYIIENSPVTDTTKFKCFKLVKKDQDVSKMSFVSFKINVSPDDFDKLIDVNIWPSYVNIREFVQISPPKPTLEQFLPRTLAHKSSPVHRSKIAKPDQPNGNTSNEKAEDMEILVVESSTKNGSTEADLIKLAAE